MILNDALADRQPHAGARQAIRRTRSFKHAEYPLCVFFRNAQSVVLHANAPFVAYALAAHRDMQGRCCEILIALPIRF